MPKAPFATVAPVAPMTFVASMLRTPGGYRAVTRRWPLVLAFQPGQGFQLSVVKEDTAAVVALLKVDAVAVIRAHGSTALRTLHECVHSPPL